MGTYESAWVVVIPAHGTIAKIDAARLGILYKMNCAFMMRCFLTHEEAEAWVEEHRNFACLSKEYDMLIISDKLYSLLHNLMPVSALNVLAVATDQQLNDMVRITKTPKQ